MNCLLMHSDGEFKEGVFKAVDGSGNSLTIGTEKNDTESKLTIEGAEKAEFGTKFETHEASAGTYKAADFIATIGGIVFQVVGSAMSIGGQAIEGLSVAFAKGEDNINFSLPSLRTLEEMMNAVVTRIEQAIPKNIKDGTGTGGVISGTVSGNNACVASGENSFACGTGCRATGSRSFVGGGYATAEGTMAFAYGDGAEAKGNKSAALNLGYATGENSLAVNGGSASAKNSFGCGRASAKGESSSAFCQSSALGLNQFTIGRYNIEQGTGTEIQPTDNAFIIGNGTSSNARSNALAVRWDGAIVLANGTVLTVEQLAKVANLT